jgi:hypothetical protein
MAETAKLSPAQKSQFRYRSQIPFVNTAQSTKDQARSVSLALTDAE